MLENDVWVLEVFMDHQCIAIVTLQFRRRRCIFMRSWYIEAGL